MRLTSNGYRAREATAPPYSSRIADAYGMHMTMPYSSNSNKGKANMSEDWENRQQILKQIKGHAWLKIRKCK